MINQGKTMKLQQTRPLRRVAWIGGLGAPAVALHVALSVAGLAALAGCGGGGADANGRTPPTVSNVSASPVMYGRNIIVTVSGQALDNGVSLDMGGLCLLATPLAGGTDATQSFSCRVSALGARSVQVLRGEGQRIAQLDLLVPPPQVSITTTLGVIVVELDPLKAPITVNNLLDYVNRGFYNSTVFHRVIKGDVIQAGGFTGGASGLVGKTSVNAPIKLESNNGLLNLRGTIGMAREAGFDTATSQFFFNVQDNAKLDFVSDSAPGFAVFGQIVQGLAVMDAISAVATGTRVATIGSETRFLPDVPATDVVISAATQIK